MLALCNGTGILHVVPLVNVQSMAQKRPFRGAAAADHQLPVAKGCTHETPWLCSPTSAFADNERCTQTSAADSHIDVLIIDMTSRFMALQRLPRTIRLLESLGRQLDTGVVSFEFTEFTAIGYGNA